MKKLNLEEIIQVAGGSECTTCLDFGFTVYACVDAQSAPYLANLVGAIYGGSIVTITDFTNAISADIAAGADFNQISIEKIDINKY